MKKLPRKTLFKPVKRPNLEKDPLWREVFLDIGSESEEDGDDYEGNEEDNNFDLSSMFKEMNTKRSGMNTVHGGGGNKKKNNVEFSLPPIMRPLLSDAYYKKDLRKKSSAGKLRTAE